MFENKEIVFLKKLTNFSTGFRSTVAGQNANDKKIYDYFFNTAKSFIGSVDADYAMLGMFLGAAFDFAEMYMKRSILPDTRLVITDARNSDIILPYAPVVGINSVNLLHGDGVYRPYQAYKLNYDSIFISDSGRFAVEYLVGYNDPSAVPDAILYGVMSCMRLFYLERRSANVPENVVSLFNLYCNS